MNFLKFTKKSKSNYPTMQSGRSMIEMLGVLAVVGLLSIGGLLAYRLGMNRHNANVLLDDVNRFTFVIRERADSLALNSMVDKGDFVPNGQYAMEGFLGSETEYFSIKAFNIPKGVCSASLERGSANYIVRVNPNGAVGSLYFSEDQDLCAEDNDLIFYFGKTDYLEDEIEAAQGGEGGQGDEGSSCPNGQHLVNGNCVDCPSIPNCTSYDAACKCTTCDEYYDLTATGVCCQYVTNCQSYGEGCKCSSCGSDKVSSSDGRSCCDKIENCSSYDGSNNCNCSLCDNKHGPSGAKTCPACGDIEGCVSYAPDCSCSSCASGSNTAPSATGKKCCASVPDCAVYDDNTCECIGCSNGFGLVAKLYSWPARCCPNIEDCDELGYVGDLYQNKMWCGCTKCASGKTYTSNEFEMGECNIECSDNSSCPEGRFCAHSPGTSHANCIELSTYSSASPMSILGSTWIKTESTMDWFSAGNWCAAHKRPNGSNYSLASQADITDAAVADLIKYCAAGTHYWLSDTSSYDSSYAVMWWSGSAGFYGKDKSMKDPSPLCK